MMQLYIRNHPNEVCQPWWDRFEATLVQRYIGDDAPQTHIEDRRRKLEAAGAFLKWDKEIGVPYLEFESDKRACWFMLKWGVTNAR